MSTDENHNNNEHIISNSNIDKSINILNNDSEIKKKISIIIKKFVG